MISTLNDEIIVKEFIFQTVLRKISNIFHVNSFKNKSEKLTELATMFNSNYYNSIENYIDRSGINFFLKTILKLKSAKLVYLYFTLNKAFL